MANLIIATGPARSGKTYNGDIWVRKSPSNRIMVDGDIKRVVEHLKGGLDVWLCLNTEIPKQVLPENLPGVSVKVRAFRYNK